MALVAGTRLGRYEIHSPLGAGGMGEVYRARDTVLDRTVAVKVLPLHLADDSGARQRLDREARAISSLNHPNICTLHDVGHQDGVDFLVMECLDGETLADRLVRGPLPPDQVLKYGMAICAGLERAHRSGVIHRDLKPSNIMLTKAGLKLMDFGLAKATPAVRSPTDLTLTSPEASAPLTARGVIVGTCQYMSPEQIEGKEADATSDVFALGAVLYEMATGKRAFDGKTTASVIAAVLERHPAPISTVQPMSPPALDHVVRTCLMKDPEQRWHTAHDVRLELEWIAEGAAEARASPGTVGGRVAGWLAWVIAAVMTSAVVFLVVWNAGHDALAIHSMRASLLPPEKAAFSPFNFSLSRDGSQLAFVATAADGSTALWVRIMASGANRQFINTEGAHFPFWSPDGQWVAFFADGKLKKLEVNSGSVQTVCDAPSGWGGDWNRDDVIVFAGDVAGPLDRVPAAGGVPSPVTKVLRESSAEGHKWPWFLPDGTHFLYRVDWVGAAGTYVGSLDGGASILVSHELTSNVQFASGDLVYVRSGSLVAQKFDPERLQITGEPRAVAPQDVETERAFARGNFSVSQSGSLVYFSRKASLPEFEWFDRKGTALGTIEVTGAYEPRISPDGRFVAYSAEPASDGKHNVWVHDLVRNTATQVTDGDRDGFPVWSPDGKRLVYGGSRVDGFGLYLKALGDAAQNQDQVLEKGVFLPPTDWSPDGRNVLYMDISKGLPRMYSRSVGSTAQPTEVALGSEGQFAPDGHWIAYTASPGDVFVQPYPGQGGRLQLSSGGGAQPRWRADGRELFYIAHDKKLMAVSIVAGTPLVAGAPKVLFQTHITGARFVHFQYDVAPDGQRFLINSLRPDNAAPPLTLELNWNAEPKEK